MKPKTVSVIISAYNNHEWLRKTLLGYLCQTRQPNEIIIADDGSKSETKEVIEAFANIAPFKVKHVWHEDDGFRKCIILNKATKVVESEYVIFTDQDCVPREDFVAVHCDNAEKGYFLSGGLVRFDMELSSSLSDSEIRSRAAFDLKYLKVRGYKRSFKSLKLTRNSVVARFMNFITPTIASWNGCNSSTWLEYILAVNGHNNDMVYGGEDREFGERMVNMGLKGKQVRYSAIALHLDHGRPYKNEELIKVNLRIRKNTKKNRVIKTPNGLLEV